ncbi:MULTISPECIES: dihydrofolate reductase family protein [Streptomyces]|uniref:Deaminase n=2 Tax=Streptomyces TaxID=1883 RepID=A0A101PKU8_STRCK|nr:dihydrofolate reductase family protein [Streptomyces corchorusii]AEY86024.1 dihydrofolate reductase [Streptomyces hygroscopicus subsp. jinggangensis 5008]AGF60246.1 dihydrofolate reductase [Streptomyces hygroscopicus subsp. jinggangensis TL01]ALO99572.1 Dihydrofolate reductase [Streptomyces hygroscopicus subsp. limoneus]KUN13369.1 deaminase [Streptomyces corchorusii]
MRKLTYFVAGTIDGFIAGPDGDYDFFSPYLTEDYLPHLTVDFPETLPTPARAALGVADAPNTHFDTVVMGRGTYEPGLAAGLTSPYAHLRQIVVSRSLGVSPDASVEVTTEDPVALVRRLKQEEGLGVWLCGGGDLAGQLLPEIDELIVKQYPVVAGSGIPLFRAEFSPRAFKLTGSRVFDNGTIALTYTKASA